MAVTLDAKARLNSGEFSTGLKKMERDTASSVKNIASTFGTLKNVFMGGMAVNVLTNAIGTAADREEMVFSLASVAGGLEAAKVQFERLKQLALMPGLTLESAVKGSARLQAVGMTAQQAEAALKALGNAVAMVGGAGPEIEAAATAMATMLDKADLTSREFLALAKQVPILRTAMESAFGTSSAEALEDLNVSAAELVNTLVVELGKAPKVMENLRDIMDTMKQTADDTKESIGKAFEPFLKRAQKELIELGKQWGEAWGDLKEILFLEDDRAQEAAERFKGIRQEAKKTLEVQKKQTEEAEKFKKALTEVKDPWAVKTWGDVENEIKQEREDREKGMEGPFDIKQWSDVVEEIKQEREKRNEEMLEFYNKWQNLIPMELIDEVNLRNAKGVLDAFNDLVDKKLMTREERKEARQEKRARDKAKRSALNEMEKAAVKEAEEKFDKFENLKKGKFFDPNEVRKEFRKKMSEAEKTVAKDSHQVLVDSKGHLSNIDTAISQLPKF